MRGYLQEHWHFTLSLVYTTDENIIANRSSGVGDSCVPCQNIDRDTIVPIIVAAVSSRVQPYVRLRRQLSSGTGVPLQLLIEQSLSIL